MLTFSYGIFKCHTAWYRRMSSPLVELTGKMVNKPTHWLAQVLCAHWIVSPFCTLDSNIIKCSVDFYSFLMKIWDQLHLARAHGRVFQPNSHLTLLETWEIGLWQWKPQTCRKSSWLIAMRCWFCHLQFTKKSKWDHFKVHHAVFLIQG